MGDADGEPLSDLARRVERRRAATEEGDSPEASPFESMVADAVDPEEAWAELTDDPDDAGVGAADDAEAVADAPGGEYLVPKRSFCQDCPHFADPPAFACTREGTDIVEVVDGDRFRVRNCPMTGDGDGR